MVAQEAEAGDAAARHVVLETARYLGIGAVNVMHTVDPEAVIYGGAMTFGGHDSPLGREFLERIRQEIQERAFPQIGRADSRRFCLARRRRGLHWGGGDCAGRLQADGPVISAQDGCRDVRGLSGGGPAAAIS